MSNDYTKIAKQLETYKHVQGLMRYINYESLIEEHRRQEKGKATGIDGVNKDEYGKEVKENIQQKPTELIKKINIKLIGHYRYYGITDNYNKLEEYKKYIIKTLYNELRRKGDKKKISWEKYNRILKYNPIVEPKIYVTLN